MAPLLPRLDRRRLLLSLLVALALVAFWAGISRGVTGRRDLATSDPAVENVSPHPDELVLRQTQVVVDLAPGYRGNLFIDGQQIPVVDAINDSAASTGGSRSPSAIDGVFDLAQNTITFTPTAGATIEAFAPRSHQVTVSYWKLDESPDQARNFSWSFRVQG